MKLKKLLGVLLAGACVVSGFSGQGVKVSAADEVNYKLTEAVADGNVVLTLEFVGGTAVYAGNYTIDYDTTVFEVVSTAYGTATPNSNIINPVTQEEWEEEYDDPYAPESNGSVQGNFMYTKGYKKGGTDVSVITLKLLKDSFSKDDIKFSRANIVDKDSKTTPVTPDIEVVCGHAKTHEVVKTEATCKQEGSVDIVCDVCGEVTETKSVPKKDHTWNDGEVTKAATCTEKGEKTITCTVCGDTKKEEIAALGHKYDEGKVTKEATCTEKGEKTITCTVCGDTKKEEIAALGHKYDEGKVTKEPTCTERGVKTFTCTVCGDTKTDAVEALGHDFDEGTVTKEPTCTEKGIKTFKCKSCDEVKTEEIPAVGHKFGDFEVTKVETDKEDGEMIRTCTVCGEKITETIPKLEEKNFEVDDVKGEDSNGNAVVGEEAVYEAQVYGNLGDVTQVGDVRYVPASYKIGDVVTKFEGTDYTIKFTPDAEGEYKIAIEYAREVYTADGWVRGAETFTVNKVVSAAAKAADNGANGADNGNAANGGNDANAGNAGNTANTANNGNAANAGNTGKTAPKTGDSAVMIMMLVAALAVSGTTVMFARKRREN